MDYYLSNSLVAIAAAVGFAIAVYIYQRNAQKKALVCPIGGNCDFVTSSKYANTFGIPNTVFGMLYYGLVGLVALYHLTGYDALPDWFCASVAWMSVGAFLFSLYLLYIQAFVLKRWCSWCVFSAICSTVILLAILFGDGHSFI